jgi:hypothetical protein
VSASEMQLAIEWRRELLRRRVTVHVPDVFVLQAFGEAIRPTPTAQSDEAQSKLALVESDPKRKGCVRLRIEGLPEDSNVIGCWYNHATRDFEFVVLHESFEVVKEGTIPPVLAVTHTWEAFPDDKLQQIEALKLERDRLRSLLGRLSMAETPEEASKMIEYMLEMPESEDRELAIEALKELAGGAA